MVQEPVWLPGLERQVYQHSLQILIREAVTERDKRELDRFGEIYGAEAMEQKYFGLLEERLGPDWTQKQAELMEKAKLTAQLIRGKLLGMPGKPKRVKAKVSQDRRKKVFEAKMAKVAGPYLRTLISLNFYEQVAGKWLTEAEIKELEQKLQTEPATEIVDALKEKLEARSGRPLEEITQEIVERSEDEVFEAVTGSVREFAAISESGQAEELGKALDEAKTDEIEKIFKKANLKV